MKAIVMPDFHVSQIDLVCAITKFLQDEHGITHLLSREITDIDRESIGTIHEKVAGVSSASRADWDRAIRQVARNDGIDDGVSGGLDRRCHVIGNAVVPTIAEWIGRRIAAVS